jgi:hypothetical protein
MTFEKWLLKQTHRDDPVGDLAKDFRDAKRIDASRGIKYQKCNEHHLSRWNAGPKVYDALKEARKKYKEFLKIVE